MSTDVGDVVAHVGLWWPAAHEGELRAAATAWNRSADALDQAIEAGRAGMALARAGWTGQAAERFEQAWRAHEAALRDDATGARVLASALGRYADAVAAAKRKVEQLAVTAGATIAVGVGLALLTFGTSAAAAAGVSAGLVAAAEAIGVELSATAATITSGALVGTVFGAGEAAVVDMAVTQPLRVEVFHDGGYSLREAAVAGGIGGGTGGIVGGVLGGPVAATARTPWPLARTPADDLGELDGVISAALDPGYRGALGPLFRAGLHDPPAVPSTPAAHLLASEGHSLHIRPDGAALVRSSSTDPGRVTELRQPDGPSAHAVENEILEAGGRLARHGVGDLVLDGRGVGLGVDAAGEGLADAVDRAGAQGLALPVSIRFVFDDMSIHYP